MSEHLDEWQPAIWVSYKKFKNKVFVFTTESFFKYYIPFHNLPHYFLIVACKRSIVVTKLKK